MTNKRRDSKGRILRAGESQRSDGRYMFRYADEQGVRQTVYSWRLVETDRTPKGKKDSLPLRELEKQVQFGSKDVPSDELVTNKLTVNNEPTVNDVFEKFMALKVRELRKVTISNYSQLYTNYLKSTIGNFPISSIKYSNIKKLYFDLLDTKHLSLGTLQQIGKLLHNIFEFAIRDDYISKNPTDHVLVEVKRQAQLDTKKRHALTIEQQEAFITFVRSNEQYSQYQNLFTFLLGTGCRIGEALALQWEDCDLIQRTISISHTISYFYDQNKNSSFEVSSPKTQAGKRIIPMLDGVFYALCDEKERQWRDKTLISPTEGGLSNFVFRKKNGKMYVRTALNIAIKNIISEYNDTEWDRAKIENRLPVLLPDFSLHTLRHTFCTRLCENETNLKVIQEIMGHANITITMDIYNEATMTTKVASMKNLEGKIKII